MKFKGILTLCLAGAAFGANAQTHVEGREYFKADQIDNAKELLERSLNNSGTDLAVSNYYLGMIALADNNTSAAKSYFDKGVAANPDYAYNYVGLGQLDLTAGNVKGAEANFKTAESKSKKDASLQIAIATAYYDVDPVTYQNQVNKYYEKARKTDMKNSDIYLFEGDMAKQRKDWGDAAAKYEMAANYNPDATEAYVKYANLFSMVNPKYAIDMLERLRGLQPGSALAQRELANAYYNNKDYKNAAVKYGEYVNNPSHFKQDEDRYAFLLFYSGDYQKGYDYATKLLANDASNFTAQRYQFMNAAQIPGMDAQLLPMAEALYKAHNANPAKNKFAAIDYTLIADELNKAKRPEEAVQVLQQAIQDMPDNAKFNKDLAMAYVNLNQIANAADSYQGYLQKAEEPGYNDFIQQATYSFYAGVETKDDADRSNGYFEQTLEYAGKAAEILPDNYKPKKIAGDVAKQRATEGEVASAAVPYYTEAIALLEASADPSRYATDAKDLYNYMGNYSLDQKDVAKAKEYFNKYLQYDPNNEAYRKFVESLK